MSLTSSQHAAIAANGNVLVVAGAGAGKTSTLVERCVARVLDPERPAGLDTILMVTFTEAAAAEMKLRIQKRLEAARDAATDPTLRERLDEQRALLDTAAIGTLHAFCLRLIREHFHELALDPQLTVLPEDQAQVLKEETLDGLFTAHYAGTTPQGARVQELIEVQARGRERIIRDLLLKLHDYTQTLADPAAWFAGQLAAFRETEPAVWRAWFLRGFVEWRDQWLPVLRAQPEENEPAHTSAESLTAAGDAPSRAVAATALAAIVAADQDRPHGTKSKFRDPLKAFFDDAAFLHSLAREVGPGGDGPVDPLRQDWDWVRGQMETLLLFAQEFADAFARAKREQGALDFHDFEQFALRLLWDRETQRPTSLALDLRRRFQFVFVDEYQDINAAQDRIIAAISGEGPAANRFLVGDVKQSIYRFRLSDPRIFQGYRRTWRDPALGRVIPLADNFRSHEMLLRFINPLFAALLRESIGGVGYPEDEALRYGAPEERSELTATHSPGPRAEVHLRVMGRDPVANGEDADDTAVAELTQVEHEARLVAMRLRELIDAHHEVWDPAERTFRPARWGDMVVLLRSLQNRAEIYAKEFHRLGVPLQVARGGFYDSVEITDLLSLLQLLDNPRQDVPLLAVLRSPLVGLSLDELAQIRMTQRDSHLWPALLRWRDTTRASPTVHLDTATEVTSPSPHDEGVGRGPGRGEVQERSPSSPRPSPPSAGGEGEAIATPRVVVSRCAPSAPATELKEPAATTSARERVEDFLTRYARWRRLARERPLSQRLEAILDETHYAEWLATQPRGGQRLANVQRLLALAQQFDPWQRQGLQRFLRFTEAQREMDTGSEPAPVETTEAVRLTSIHKSKGLEFPIVVVADLAKPFNTRDLHDHVMLDEEFGLCPRVKPPETGRHYPSLPYWLAQRRQKREALGEELRLLYVALTRARDTLVLVGTVAERAALEKWPAAAGRGWSDLQILGARCYLDWLGPCLTQLAGDPGWAGRDAGSAELFQWRCHDETGVAGIASKPRAASGNGAEERALLPGPTPAMIEALEARVRWTYPFAAATAERAKTSVSELKRRQAETDEEARLAFWPRGRGPRAGAGESPGLGGAEAGVAHHTFLQNVDLERTTSRASLQIEADRLREAGTLTTEQTAALDFAALDRFWQGALGERVRKHAAQIRRELPFTARFTAGDLAGCGLPVAAGLTAEEFIVVQGVADLVVLQSGEIWLVDFKTDDVERRDLPGRIEYYTPQLKVYALALERIHGRPVTECWLYFLRPGAAARV